MRDIGAVSTMRDIGLLGDVRITDREYEYGMYFGWLCKPPSTTNGGVAFVKPATPSGLLG
jgi:hypothetical protein